MGGYGQFLLRNHVGDHYVWLDASSDESFNEMGRLIRASSMVCFLKQREQSAVFQKVVGYLYDSDFNGNYYGIGIDPECPFCKKHSVASYNELVPTEHIELSVTKITANEWKQLSQDAKVAKIDSILINMGFIHEKN